MKGRHKKCYSAGALSLECDTAIISKPHGCCQLCTGSGTQRTPLATCLYS